MGSDRASPQSEIGEIMRSKFILFIVIGLISMALLTGTFTAGFLVGNTVTPLMDVFRRPFFLKPGDATPFAPESATAAPTLAAQSGTPEELQELFFPFLFPLKESQVQITLMITFC